MNYLEKEKVYTMPDFNVAFAILDEQYRPLKDYEKIVSTRVFLYENFDADGDQQYRETNLTTHYCTTDELENYFANLEDWNVEGFQVYHCLDDPT